MKLSELITQLQQMKQDLGTDPNVEFDNELQNREQIYFIDVYDDGTVILSAT